jgi:hypothetical protein
VYHVGYNLDSNAAVCDIHSRRGFKKHGYSLGICLWAAKTVDQYSLIFTAFSRYGIDLSTFILESDQVSSLTLFAKAHNITQWFCLHHFLHMVCTGTFCWGIANAVRARTVTERDRLLSELTFLIGQFCVMLTDQNSATLGKDLKKAGLGLRNGTVCIVDQRRWEQVAMSGRVDDGTPQRPVVWKVFMDIIMNQHQDIILSGLQCTALQLRS